MLRSGRLAVLARTCPEAWLPASSPQEPMSAHGRQGPPGRQPWEHALGGPCRPHRPQPGPAAFLEAHVPPHPRGDP